MHYVAAFQKELSAAQRVPFVNLRYKVSAPIKATVLRNQPLTTSPDSDVRHVVLDLEGTDYTYWPGQSVGVLPGHNPYDETPLLDPDKGTFLKDPATQKPLIDPNTGGPHRPKLYSIASSMLCPEPGFTGRRTLAIAVKRVFGDHEQKPGTPFKGICSNFICDLKPGDPVSIFGPSGKHFLLPEHEHDFHYVFLATGTGIAPFLSMLVELDALGGFPKDRDIWLLFGVRHSTEILYDSEFKILAAKYPNFHYHVAVSREMKNADGSKKYVQHLMLDHQAELFPLLQSHSTLTYVCGLKGMEGGIAESIAQMAVDAGFSDKVLSLDMLKNEHRYLEEVY